MNIQDFTQQGSCELTYNTEIKEITVTQIAIDDAYFLIYNWPDDKDGVNASIVINLHLYFILDEKKYQTGTKTTFYDYDVAKYENLQNWYFKNIYPAMVKNALVLSKKEIESKLNTSLNINPFNTQEDQIMKLTKAAEKNQHIVYV